MWEIFVRHVAVSDAADRHQWCVVWLVAGDSLSDGKQSHQIAQQECVGNNGSPQLPQVRGGMSGHQQQERMHVTERQ